MAMKGYSTLTRSLEQEPHFKMQFWVITKTPFLPVGGVLSLGKVYSQRILRPIYGAVVCLRKNGYYQAKKKKKKKNKNKNKNKTKQKRKKNTYTTKNKTK